LSCRADSPAASGCAIKGRDSAAEQSLIAHACVEAAVRFAAELGYDVTVVKDATADYSDEEMHAALDIDMPNYASAIVTTNKIVDLISSVQPWESVRSSFT
jgi:isochorismate hydrolase